MPQFVVAAFGIREPCLPHRFRSFPSLGWRCRSAVAWSAWRNRTPHSTFPTPTPRRVRNADAALPTVDWWRGFRSKQLTELIEESLTSNLDVAAAIARIVQADAQARIAGAPLLPPVGLNSGYTRSRSSQSTGTVPQTTTGASERTIFTVHRLNTSYEIDFWGKNRATLLAAQETAVASRFDREVVALTTVVSVANAYFQVAAAQDRLRVARENLAAADRVLKVIQDRFDVGTASQLDVAQQESLVASQRAAIPPLVQTVRQNIATLAASDRSSVRCGSQFAAAACGRSPFRR